MNTLNAWGRPPLSHETSHCDRSHPADVSFQETKRRSSGSFLKMGIYWDVDENDSPPAVG